MRRIVVVFTVLAVSFVGSAKAQQTNEGTTEKQKTYDNNVAVTGETAKKAEAEIMSLEKEEASLLLKGGSAEADFFDRVDAPNVIIAGGDGELHSKADHIALWRSGALTLQSQTRSDEQLQVYDNGDSVTVTYHSVAHMTRDGKQQVRSEQLWDSWVKKDGEWLRVVHAGAGKGM